MNKKRNEYRKRNKKQISKTTKSYKINNPWLTTLSNIQQRCENPRFPKYEYYGGRGIECQINSKELKFLWFRDKAYNMKKPSIDRENNDGNYTLENCQFIEMNINRIKNHIKPVEQYDLKNNFIQKFFSMRDAFKRTVIHHSGISACCRGIQKTAGGYIWKYKE